MLLPGFGDILPVDFWQEIQNLNLNYHIDPHHNRLLQSKREYLIRKNKQTVAFTKKNVNKPEHGPLLLWEGTFFRHLPHPVPYC